jgi:hypothetical protein
MEVVWQINRSIKTARLFEITSKRRKGFPSETQVKRGMRVVHGNKKLRDGTFEIFNLSQAVHRP